MELNKDIIMNSGAYIYTDGVQISDIELSYLNNVSDNIQTQITNNDNDISNIESDILAIESDILAIYTDVSNNTADILINADDIATLQTDISDIQTDIIAMQSDISVNANAIYNNDIDIMNIQNDITNIQNDVTDIQTDILINTNDITDMQTDIYNNTVDISNIQHTLTPLSYLGGGYDDLTITSDFLMNKNYGLYNITGTGAELRLLGTNCRLDIRGTNGVIEFPDNTEQATAFSTDYSTLLDDISRNANEWSYPTNTILKAVSGGAIDEIRCDHFNCYQKIEFPDTSIQTTAFTSSDRTNLDTLTSKKQCYWEEIDGPVTYFTSMSYNTTYQTSSGGHYMTSSELSTTPTGGDSNMIDVNGYIQYTGRYMLQVSFEIMGIKSWTDIRARVLVKQNGTLDRATLYGPGVWDANRGSVSTVGCTLAPLIFTINDVADNWTFEIHTYNDFQTVGSGSIFWKTHIDLVQL